MASVELWFDSDQFPLYKDTYSLTIQNKETRNETEAGTVIRDIKRTGVPHLSVSCPVSDTWYQKLNTVSGTSSVTIKYLSPTTLAMATFSGFLDNLKFDLITDNTSARYWKASFEVTAY